MAGVRAGTLRISTVGGDDMPVIAVKDYLPTLTTFIAHWKSVNAERVGNPVVLPIAYKLADLQADRAALEAAIHATVARDTDLRLATRRRDLLKDAIRPRLTRFRATVTALIPGSVYEQTMPRLAPINSRETTYLKPLGNMATVWGAINAVPPPGFVPPFVLAGGYRLADFQAEVAALTDAYRAASVAALDARLARKQRDILLPNLDRRMVQYRVALRALLPADSALLQSAPAYSQ